MYCWRWGIGERVCHVDDEPELEVHIESSNGGSGRIRWTAVSCYDVEGSQNNGKRKDLFHDTPGGFGNMQPGAHEDGLNFDVRGVASACISLAGYAEKTGIKEEEELALWAVNSHALVVISNDDVSETVRTVAVRGF